MQYLLDQLEQDHHRILQMMYSLSNELNHYSNDDNCTKILNILNYIRVYPEIWHHPTEDVLFNQLLSKPSISFKVVNELLKEHPHLEALSVELSGIYQECQSLESPPSIKPCSLAVTIAQNKLVTSVPSEIFSTPLSSASMKAIGTP